MTPRATHAHPAARNVAGGTDAAASSRRPAKLGTRAHSRPLDHQDKADADD
ncbi:MAG: hypothetical protein WDN31_13615 [Hyphomicrobium sp.]